MRLLMPLFTLAVLSLGISAIAGEKRLTENETKILKQLEEDIGLEKGERDLDRTRYIMIGLGISKEVADTLTTKSLIGREAAPTPTGEGFINSYLVYGDEYACLFKTVLAPGVVAAKPTWAVCKRR